MVKLHLVSSSCPFENLQTTLTDLLKRIENYTTPNESIIITHRVQQIVSYRWQEWDIDLPGSEYTTSVDVQSPEWQKQAQKAQFVAEIWGFERSIKAAWCIDSETEKLTSLLETARQKLELLVPSPMREAA